MANTKLLLKGSRNLSVLHLRFYHGRTIDIQSKTNILVEQDHWDPERETYRNVNSIPNLLQKKNQLEKLRSHVIDRFNTDYTTGEVIDSRWLSEVIKDSFSRPVHEKKDNSHGQLSYYSGFVSWWLDNEAARWKTGRGKFLDAAGKKQYQSFFKIWKKFEGARRYKLKEVTAPVVGDFVDFMDADMDYSQNTIKRHVGRLKFFLTRAEMHGLSVSPDYKERTYVGTDDIPKPYLNESEIEDIFEIDFDDDIKLDNIRDSMIIGLWTGLRISDFNKKLDVSNINGEYISIRTQKTGAWVIIPLHPQVQYIIKKRHGCLPVRYNDSYFNKGVKTICMIAGIDQEIKGKLYDKDAKRSVPGVYKKWQLISSHTCRRSFASNLYGTIPDHILADVGGWSTVKMMIHYVKRTKQESADVLKKRWDEQYG